MKDHVGEELVHVDDGDEEAEYVDDKMTSGGQVDMSTTVCRLSYLVREAKSHSGSWDRLLERTAGEKESANLSRKTMHCNSYGWMCLL